MSVLRATSLSALFLAAATIAGCEQETPRLPPFGEVRLAIDTDLAVPSWVGRVRIDLFDGQGAWLDTRDFATLEPSDFPLTFSLFTLDERTARDAFVRVRMYPEADLRPYRGERFEPRPSAPAQPTPAETMDDLCAAAPPLPLGQRVRVTATHATQAGEGVRVVCGTDCSGAPSSTRTGLGAASLTIAEAGTYVIEATAPEGVQLAFDTLDPLLSIRTSCADETSEIACNDNADDEVACVGTGSLAYGPRITADLAPGTYVVLFGNRLAAAMTMDLSARLVGADLPPPLDPPKAGVSGDGPRLVQDGVDVTPELEPAPAVTVDRLVAIHVDPGVVRTAAMLLSGECLGTMADLAGRRSCVDRENELSPLAPLATSEGRTRGESRVGSWSAYAMTPCTVPATAGDPSLRNARACIEGGAFVLGDLGAIEFGDLDATPRRPAIVAPFLMDTHEVTIARYRAAYDAGFVAPAPPGVTEFDLAADTDCPFSLLTPHPERAGLAMTCVSYYTARAFCRFEGGDLPTAAQREYAATTAGRDQKTGFPWGDFDPTCDTMAFGRANVGQPGVPLCNASGGGAVAVDATPWAERDVTPAGIVGLGGNVREWLRDAHRSYDDVCWQAAPLHDPACLSDEASFYSIAGSSWRRGAKEARGATRQREAPPTALGSGSDVGFRCVYAGTPGANP